MDKFKPGDLFVVTPTTHCHVTRQNYTGRTGIVMRRLNIFTESQGAYEVRLTNGHRCGLYGADMTHIELE